MRFLHCGDFHLDSPLTANLTGEKKKQRKKELLLSFVRIMDYAEENKADAVLISGDLFDYAEGTKTTRNLIIATIRAHEKIEVFYLRGNHELNENTKEAFSDYAEELPLNLHLFSSEWKNYRLGDVVITGAELTKENRGKLFDGLWLKADDKNIVILHGQVEKGYQRDADTIPLLSLKNKNIDYLALSHIHKFSCEPLDERGTYCYCGCPEGRGFDECGEKGFVWLETTANGLAASFIPFAKREIYEIFVDITETYTTPMVEEKIREAVNEISQESLVRVSLTGRVSIQSECDIRYLTERFSEKFFSFQVNRNAVGLLIQKKDYEEDLTLRGEFIRLVMEGEYSEEDKRILLELGLKALSGEEVESCF